VSICFYVDILGKVEQNSILMERTDQERLVRVADSFTEWLKLIIEKEGQLETL
jgi:hypothetical protein